MPQTFTPTSIREGRRRRFVHRAHGQLSVALALLLLAMINVISSHLYTRVDISRAPRYALSPKSVRLIQNLDRPVDVIALLQAGHESYRDVTTLLREYEYVSRGRIRVEVVDPDRNLARVEELAGRYDLPDLNVILFATEGRTRWIAADDLAVYDYAPLLEGRMPRRAALVAEQQFSSAILSITAHEAPVVYVLTGHGEGDLFDPHPFSGFSRAAEALQRDDIQVVPLNLADAGAVPGDADALVIPGPKQPLATSEIRVLGDHLRKSGRVFLMLDHADDAGLVELLRAWGIRFESGIVVDPGHTLSGLDLFVRTYAPHPVTEDLAGKTTVFSMPRPVLPVADGFDQTPLADEPRYFPLALSTSNGWAETAGETRPFQFDPADDLPGPVPVAAAVEQGTAPSLGVEIRPARLVVVGDSDFLSNGGLSGVNLDFFLNGVNWLLDRDHLLSIAPRPLDNPPVLLDRGRLDLLFWIVVAGMPGAVGLLGALVHRMRRT